MESTRMRSKPLGFGCWDSDMAVTWKRINRGISVPTGTIVGATGNGVRIQKSVLLYVFSPDVEVVVVGVVATVVGVVVAVVGVVVVEFVAATVVVVGAVGVAVVVVEFVGVVEATSVVELAELVVTVVVLPLLLLV